MLAEKTNPAEYWKTDFSLQSYGFYFWYWLLSNGNFFSGWFYYLLFYVKAPFQLLLNYITIDDLGLYMFRAVCVEAPQDSRSHVAIEFTQTDRINKQVGKWNKMLHMRRSHQIWFSIDLDIVLTIKNIQRELLSAGREGGGAAMSSLLQRNERPCRKTIHKCLICDR